MSIEIEVRNTDESENPENAIVVRTYSNKGNIADDGEVLQPGQSLSRVLDDQTFIQADTCANPEYVAPVVEVPETPEVPDGGFNDAEDNPGSEVVGPDGRTDIERQADEEAERSRQERGVTKADDEAALAAEVAGNDGGVNQNYVVRDGNDLS